MQPLSFECDYNNGAHPQVLQALIDSNGEPSLTYGFDRWSHSAKAKILEACHGKAADVYFLTGGTQTNATVIDAMLRSHEAVIAADSGHIAIHEAGAIEHSGHKVITLPGSEGRLSADAIDTYMRQFSADESRDHLAQPALVYISLPTELGTLYSTAQLADISATCRRHGLRLFIDGARLAYALAADSSLSLPLLCDVCDAFYIGGTKCGALCGEAVVFTHTPPTGIFPIIKQHGALLAKGRLTGIQFDALFTDNLYFEIGRHAIDMAHRLRTLLTRAGMTFAVDSPTNQQFVIVDNTLLAALKPQVDVTVWGPYDADHTLIRFVTSWSTTTAQLQQLEDIIMTCC